VGVLCFSLGITGKIAGACMIANAIFNTFVLCKVRIWWRRLGRLQIKTLSGPNGMMPDSYSVAFFFHKTVP